MNRTVRLFATALPLLTSLQAVAASDLHDRVRATNQFEYSYSTDTEREIVENWLDVSYYHGPFHTGLLLNAQQPSEEGDRRNEIRHRFFEFSSGGFDVRAGHFYGLFGRGLLFAAYEDRVIRVDSVLDGVIASTRRGRFQGTLFSGATSVSGRDVRGLDLQYDPAGGWTLATTILTYRIDDAVETDGSIHREWVFSERIEKYFSFGDCYLEYGWKDGYDDQPGLGDDSEWLDFKFPHGRHGFYGALNLYQGPLALALEGKSYRRFAILPESDGRVPLNRPPALAREHLYTLLNRAPHNLDPDDERGGQAELTYSGPAKWNVLLNVSRTERHDGQLLFEEAYGHIEKERWRNLRLRGGFGYADSEGLRQTVIADVTWFLNAISSLTLQAEHQHVRLGGGEGFDLGAFDQEFLKLEYGRAPSWTFTGMLEVNNKYRQQREFREKAGPFPALQISYATGQGSQLSVWAGKRQAGQLCSGGVCKFEPAFEGVELTGVFRY